jgi:hypothetical protein
VFARQLPIILISFGIAEFYPYKFGSFAIECLAFLATWLVIDFIFEILRSIVLSARRSREH